MDSPSQSFLDKLKINLSSSHKFSSNYVIGFAGALWAWYLTQSEPTQQLIQQWIITTLHVPPATVPIVVSLIGFLARAWPQTSVTPAVAEAKSAQAPQPPTAAVPNPAQPATPVDLDPTTHL